MNIQFNEEDLIGSEICFLLTVEYLGKEYRFSTFPIELNDSRDNLTHRYEGGLNDPSFTQSTKIVGVDLEGDSISLELVFEDIDWVEEWKNGRFLDHSVCLLSMVAVRDGKSLHDEMNKIHILKGKAVEPIFGVPNRNRGYISFSVQNDNTVTSSRLLVDSFQIDVYKFPNLEGLVEFPKGKYAPFVFGKLGKAPQRDSNGTDDNLISFNDKGHISPAYTINQTGSGITAVTEYIIAGHVVNASTARIFDQQGGNFRNNITISTDSDGNTYSALQYQVGSVIEDNSFVPALDNDQTFWVSWGEDEGGYIGIDGTPLQGAGDLCLYVLNLLNLEVDTPSWVGLAPVLKEYKFGGYFNDPQVKAFDWLKKQIIPYLPIEVVDGPNGIKPVLNLYYYCQVLEPQYTIYTSGEFEIITGIQPFDVDIVNKLQIEFCYQGEFDSYLSSIEVDPQVEEETAFIVKDQTARISFERYGLQEEVLSIPFLWDLGTALRIARDRIKQRGLGATGIEVEAVGRYGFLALGDVISLTSDNLGLKDHPCQVVRKSWNNGKWKFVLQLESNTIYNLRKT